MCCRRMLVEGVGTLREEARGRDVVPCWRILGEGAGYLAGGCSGRFPRKEADRFRDASRSRRVDHHLAVVVVSDLSCWKALWQVEVMRMRSDSAGADRATFTMGRKP